MNLERVSDVSLHRQFRTDVDIKYTCAHLPVIMWNLQIRFIVSYINLRRHSIPSFITNKLVCERNLRI